MSTTEHDRVEELLAVRALGGLEERELVEYERIRADHGLDCEVCRRAELEFDEVAGRLAFALGPVAVPAGMEDALLQRAIEERPAAPVADAEAEPRTGRPATTDELRRQRDRRSARGPGGIGRRIAAVAAVVALVAGAFAFGLSIDGSNNGTGQQQALAAYLLQPDVQVVRFDATDGGNLAVAFQPGHDESFVFGADLQPVPAGKQYELWMFPPDGGAPAPGPTFDPPAEGTVVIVPVPADVSASSLMAVTVEKAGGVGAPTRDPVFTAPITTA